MPLDPKQKVAREFIEHVWRTKRGYSDNVELIATETEWAIYEELLLTNWDETKNLIGRH